MPQPIDPLVDTTLGHFLRDVPNLVGLCALGYVSGFNMPPSRSLAEITKNCIDVSMVPFELKF